ncbi:unnamed protein product [Symbiodinium sp. CCMP2592]|nr:unnamed protein product [Symbiodinium sp. CCMP2592]
MDDFVTARVAQHCAEEGQITTVVVYFAGHGVENAAGQLNVCLSDVGHSSNNASHGFMSAKTLTDNLVAKISKKAGSSKGLACLAFWDCCRMYTPQLPHKPPNPVRNKLQLQHAEIRSCKSGQAARDGVFASALCRYVERNDCYQLKELYELVNADVEKATYRYQTCSFICESTELSLRADLFVTPAKWAECCFKLEELKPDEVGEVPNETAFFTENLELKEQTQRLQDEKNQMQQMQTFLVKEDDRVRFGSTAGKWGHIVFVPAQLCCLYCTFRSLLLPLVVEVAVQQCEKDLRKIQSSQALLSIWHGLLVGGTTIAIACAWSLRMKNTTLASRNQVLSQDVSKLHEDLQQSERRLQEIHQTVHQLRQHVQRAEQACREAQQAERQEHSKRKAAEQAERQEHSKRKAAEQELEVVQDARRRAANYRRANVVRRKEVYFSGIFTNCCLCGKEGIGKEYHWRSKENSNCSFCCACIDDELE